MEEIIELSSDSDDTIILDNCIAGPSKQPDSFDDIENDLPLIKRIRKKDDISDDLQTLNDLLNKYKQNDDIVEIVQQSSTAIVDKENNRKLDKEKQKEERLKLRQEKKEAADREKAIKQALATSNKILKPDECLKFIVVNLDDNLRKEKYTEMISTMLESAGISSKFTAQAFPNCITWTRIVQSHLMNDDGQLTLSPTETQTDELLLILNAKDFVEFVTKTTLHDHIDTLQSIYNNKRIFLVVFSLKKYFKRHQRIPRDTIETMLNELQLFHSCSHRFIETDDDLSQFIFQFTKSIAQIPFKEKRDEVQQKTDWYAAGDNKNCVKIDANGNGLQRLWHQQLTTFPLASLETAEAVSIKYPTLSSLMTAYDRCATRKDGQELLQDVPIRRAAGPLVSVRKIGPELAKKIYNFYTSTDGDSLL